VLSFVPMHPVIFQRKMKLNSFETLQLCPAILKAVQEENYLVPTPVQARAIPYAMSGRDVLGIAQTGTGKTAAFALPILEQLIARQTPTRPRLPSALVLAPTRELAKQIVDDLLNYGRYSEISALAIYGGVGLDPQIRSLAAGVDIVVATPGRLIDLMQRKAISLAKVGILVLDEADRMLDMGFVPDIRRIAAILPKRRQNLFFSATMPREVDHLVADLLADPVRVEVMPAASTAERIHQQVLFIGNSGKVAALAALLDRGSHSRALVFTRTKRGADRVGKHMVRLGYRVGVLHGNKSQKQRENTLQSFRLGSTQILVATDIAARGIDVQGISHVINFDVPSVAETYVHRIGRTARAGAAGVALTLCSSEEKACLRTIERLTGTVLSIIQMSGLTEVNACENLSAKTLQHSGTPLPRKKPGTIHKFAHGSARNRPFKQRKTSQASSRACIRAQQ
jgi:ATP-dependent RNA helicase RhlE